MQKIYPLESKVMGSRGVYPHRRPFVSSGGFFFLLILVLIMGFFAGAPTPAFASSVLPSARSFGVVPQNPVETDAECLKCHKNQAMSTTWGILESDKVSLYVDPTAYNNTVHLEAGLACIGCHVGYKPESGHGNNFNSRREATLTMSDACGRCHGERQEEVMDGVHAEQIAAGNIAAAVCSDCHSPHTITRIKDKDNGLVSAATHFSIAKNCEKCHSAIYEKYSQSVHGQANIEQNNPDVPTCTNCHGAHNIEDPRTMAYRLRSPQICAKCHTNLDVMAKYGLSTEVMNTYVSDFHGTTVTIFEKVSPDAESNKPVCYDCHGIHDISRTDDPTKGLEIKQNLLKTCQKCHPDATANFPDSWTSHYIPDADKYPSVYYINLFYQFFIPAVLGPMGILVLLDFGRSMLDKFSSPKRKTTSPKVNAMPKKKEEGNDGETK